MYATESTDKNQIYGFALIRGFSECPWLPFAAGQASPYHIERLNISGVNILCRW